MQWERWSRKKSPSRRCACTALAQRDWMRALYALRGLVLGYISFTGYDLTTATQHVHDLLLHQDMWSWATQICTYLTGPCVSRRQCVPCFVADRVFCAAPQHALTLQTTCVVRSEPWLSHCSSLYLAVLVSLWVLPQATELPSTSHTHVYACSRQRSERCSDLQDHL